MWGLTWRRLPILVAVLSPQVATSPAPQPLTFPVLVAHLRMLPIRLDSIMCMGLHSTPTLHSIPVAQLYHLLPFHPEQRLHIVPRHHTDHRHQQPLRTMSTHLGTTGSMGSVGMTRHLIHITMDDNWVAMTLGILETCTCIPTQETLGTHLLQTHGMDIPMRTQQI